MSSYGTVLDVTNNVLKKMHVDVVTSVGENRYSQLVLSAINETMVDIASVGGTMRELRFEVDITAQSSVAILKVSAERDINHIEDIYFGSNAYSLEFIEPYQLRKFKKSGNSYGTPYRCAVVGTSCGVPEIEMWPAPNEEAIVNISGYLDVPIYNSADSSTLVPFDLYTIAQGAYALLVLEENSDSEFKIQWGKYTQMRDSRINRLTSDMGSEVKIRY
jgi:hypothetical protein